MGSAFIMSDFKLNVESPYPIPSREVLQLKPDVLKQNYQNTDTTVIISST
jgi:hypothetical protein